jgi:hypothetical protein
METLPIKYRDLPAAALNQSYALQFSGGIRMVGLCWPLNTQHFREKVLRDRSASSSLRSAS